MNPRLETALFQWEEGERRLRSAGELERQDLERAAALVLEELRRRLGSAFLVDELCALYSSDVEWASPITRDAGAGTDGAWVIDAAFARYAREAADFAGGRPRQAAAALEH